MATKKNSIKLAKTSKPTTAAGKETIYVDVDDEITHIIDKVKGSNAKIIALVLPKRATVLQSLVNMKLLKRSATASKKNLVLITTEASLMPLAGAASIHVAKSLQSKPEIPASPTRVEESTIEEIDPLGDRDLDKTESVGNLAESAEADDDDDVIEFDNIKTDDIKPAAAGAAFGRGKNKKAKQKKDRKLKVPNFDRFRTGIVLAVAGVFLLIFGWILAFMILPKANILVKTDTTSSVASFDFTASVNQQDVDVDAMKIPAEKKETSKTDTEKGSATGERDDGTKAKGEVTLSVPCASGDSTVVPSGTAVSSGGMSYITQSSVTLDEHSSSPCRFTADVNIVASENGDKFNLGSNKSFSVAGFSNVTGRNSDEIDGGTSKITKIVTQKDIDDAVARITAKQGDAVKDELSSELESDKLFAIKETFTSSDPKINSTPGVNAEASDFTVTYETTYSMLGVNRDDLEKLVKKDVEGEIDFEKQSLIDNGIDTSVMRINNSQPDQAFISFRTSVVAGPELDQDAIKEAIRGKKRGEVESYIKDLVGVQDVTVDYSPFWVYSTPKAAKKITITIEKPSDQSQESQNSSNE